ncbi:MAG TPA: hypothetical protein PKD76_06245 [Solirubrobacterales bacterium]|nr:hypothetical protein [Solirubrobacterales bacterium]
MFGRRSALWLAAAAISVLSIGTVQVATAAAEEPCNGAVELCGRSLDQVVLPGTHNSMSNEEYGWLLPNQHFSIPTQLQKDIRAFLIDTHYGKPDGSGGVINWNNATDGNPAGVAGTYLCHSYCSLGASDLAGEFSKVASFLAANPREVLVFVVENGINPNDFATAVTASGLIGYIYTGPTSSYPTLGQMIATNQRVVMLSEGNTGSVPWFHNGYAGPMQETPYDFRKNEAGDPMTTAQGMDLLTNPLTLNSTCRPNRGGQSGPLFLMNHWVNGTLDNGDPISPDPAVADVLNTKDLLVNRARACEQRRGKLPTIVAVDDFGNGDLIGAVDSLNGISRPIAPTTVPEPVGALLAVKKPKSANVKAGKVAIYRVFVRNTGDTDAAGVRVCAKAPGRLARRSSCAVLTVKAAGSRTATVRVRTRASAAGRGTVKFTVKAGDVKLVTKAGLVVKRKSKRKSGR